MNLQQLRIIREAARCNYNLTEVANTLYTSQSGVSRHIKELEDELNIELFIRQGKRLINMTEPGLELVVIAERILNEINNIRRLSTSFSNKDEGSLVIATTHSQARYILPNIIKRFRTQFPLVNLIINQASSEDIAKMLLSGEADIAIDKQKMESHSIVTYPFYRWHYAVIAPKNHLLANEKQVSLDMLNALPLITYRKGVYPRNSIDSTFFSAGLSPNVILNVQDSDVIKTYVEAGMGIGILVDKMFDPQQNPDLVKIDSAHLFPSHVTWIGLKRYQLQRNYVWHFIQLCNDALSIDKIKAQALSSENKVDMIEYQI
ncbi:LysR substrate-binding domain-containing protein [Orbus wheelerorum]|uniref:LysR substrate-binding domain-containing protein n=1 Tax=Orbus wheelerorum TaxID=3074111 RepID=UPI00370D43EC